MTKWKYALEPGGAKALEISTGTFIWQKKTKVRLNGQLIGEFPSQQELAKGQLLQLPDGSVLRVQFVQTFSALGFRVLRNDKPLPGSLSTPAAIRLTESFGIMYFIAGLAIVLGSMAFIFQVEFLQTLGFGVISMAMGLIFLVLGFFTQRRFLIALILALIIYGLDTALPLINGILTVLAQSSAVNSGIPLLIADILVALAPLTFVFILRLALLWGMGQGVGAINELKKETLSTVS